MQQERVPLSARYFTPGGYVNWHLLNEDGAYVLIKKSTLISDLLNLEKFQADVVRVSDSNLIARFSDYSLKEGWLIGFVSPQGSRCDSTDLGLDKVFFVETEPVNHGRVK